VLRYHSIGLPVVEVPFPAAGSGIVVAVGYDVVVVRIREANADDVIRVSGVVRERVVARRIQEDAIVAA